MSEDTLVLGKDMVFADTPSKVAFSESELQRFVSKGSIQFSGPDSKLVSLRQQAPLRFLFPELEDIGARSIAVSYTHLTLPTTPYV